MRVFFKNFSIILRKRGRLESEEVKKIKENRLKHLFTLFNSLNTVKCNTFSSIILETLSCIFLNHYNTYKSNCNN